MPLGLNVGSYAAVNRLIAFVPCSVMVAHEGTLFAHVLNRYDSYRRGTLSTGFAAPPVLITFAAPHVLAMPSRNRRPICSPAAVATPGDEGGVEPSRARMTL